MYPEAGGSSTFARRAFNEFWSFFAAWGQMLNYVVDGRDQRVLRPALPRRRLLGRARHSPGDIIFAAAIIDRHPGAINVVGAKESAGLNIALAVVDFLTQVLLVIVGAFLVLSTRAADRERHARRRADLEGLHPRDPDRDDRLHRHRDDLEHGRGGQGRGQDDPGRDQARARSPCSRSTSRCRRSRSSRCRSSGSRTARTRRCWASPRSRAARGRPDRGRGRAIDLGDVPATSGDLRRHPGRDDPVPGHQRRADRRVAARLLDGHPPPAARPAAAAAPEVPHAVDRDPRLRGRRDPDHAARARRRSSATSTPSGRCCRSRSPTSR